VAERHVSIHKANHTVITYISNGIIMSSVVDKEHFLLNSPREAFVHGDGEFSSEILRSEDEGITWLRGYHKDGSKEADALLVAYALRGAA
jgi:hypothetical protein